MEIRQVNIMLHLMVWRRKKLGKDISLRIATLREISTRKDATVPKTGLIGSIIKIRLFAPVLCLQRYEKQRLLIVESCVGFLGDVFLTESDPCGQNESYLTEL